MVKSRTSVTCLFAIVLMTDFFLGVSCFYSSLCIGTPMEQYTTSYISSIGKHNQEYQNQPSSYSTIYGKGCRIIEPSIQWTPHYIIYNSTDMSLDTTEDNVLLGWLHIDIKFKNHNQNVIVQPFVPEHKATYIPGEIVSTRFRPGLKEKIQNWDMPKDHLSPCYFVSDPSPFHTVAFVFRNISHISSLKLNFRMDFPECAMVHEKRNLEFRFFANRYGNQEYCHNSQKLFTCNQNKTFVKNATYGSYDPEPPRDAPIEVRALGSSMPSNIWVTDYSQSYLESDNQPVEIESWCLYLATQVYERFVGRCSRLANTQWEIGRNTILRCLDENSHRVGPGYVIHNPQFPPGTIDCGGCEAARNNTRTKGLSANSEIGEIISGFRTTHGIAMVMTTMFVVPLGTLSSRYYKETLMGTRFVNVHVWHGIHISTALTAFAGLFSGWVAAFSGRSFFGFSRHSLGYVHWILDYISFLAFLLALFPGPFRAFTKGRRKMTIFLHFLVATVARVLWLLCLLTSFYIPGSPSARNDIHVSGFTVEFHALIVVAWFIVDVVLNVILMVSLMGTDKQVKKRRTYALTVPIPLIRPYAQEDLPGAPLRKILLAVHTSVCLVCAFVLTTQICWSSPAGRWFGPMWYTHKDSGKLNMLMKESFYD